MPYFARNEQHFFTGKAPEDQSATVQANCGKCAVKPYSMSVGPLQTGPTSIRDINATLTKVDGSGDVSLSGKLFCQNVSSTYVCSQLQWLEGSRFAAFMIPGVPPPPPGPKCADASDKKSCDSTTPSGGASCSWCVSHDKVHSLCFNGDAKPPSTWDCDQ